MGQNMITTVAPRGTLTLDSKVNALTFVADGTGSFYWANSSNTTAPTANASSNAWIGGVPFTIRSSEGIRIVTFTMADTTNSATVYSGINIGSAAGN